MEQKSRLVIEIDSTYAETNLKKLDRTLSATEKQGEKTASSADKLGKYFANASGQITDANGKFVSATKAAKSLGVSVDELSKYTIKLERTTKSNTDTTKQATRSNDQHTQSLGMMTSNLKSALLATTALTGGLGGLSVVAMETAADINRFATNVDMSTYDFQYYAASMGVAGKTMRDYGDALKDVYDRLGEVGRGEGEMMDFFEKIAPKVGITADMFKDLSGQEALQLYYNGLEKANLSQAEMVTYMEQIVNDGSYLLPLLKNNGAEFERLGRLANDSGAIMSDSMNKSLIELRGALAEGQMQVKGLGYNLLSNLLPAIKFVAENLDTLVKLGTLLAALYGGKVAAAFAMSAASIAKDTIATVANNNAKKTMIALSASLRGGLPGLAVGVTAAAIAYLLMSENATKANNALLNTNETIEASIKKFNEMGKAQKESQLDSEQAKLKELSNQYENLTSKLISTVISMGRFDDSASSAVKEANNLAMQFKQDGDLIAFTNGINRLNGLSDEAKVKFRTQAGALEELSKKHANQKKLTDTLTQSMTANAKAVENATGKLQGYSVELTKLLKENKEETYKGQLVAALTQRYGSEDFANQVYEARKAAGILGTTKNLPSGVFADLKKQWEQQEKNKKQIEDINEAEEKRKKTIEEQTKALKVNSKVRENAQKHNFGGLEQKYGLPSGLLSAINMQESRGKATAIGPMTKYGTAKGGFQFLDDTAKRFGLFGDDVYDTGKAAEAAAKYFQVLYKKFGNWDKAISAYHAGEGNVERGTKIGPVNRQYVKNIKGYMGGATGAASVVDDEYTFDDYIRDATKAAEEQYKLEKEREDKRLELRLRSASEIAKIDAELQKELQEISEAGFDENEAKKLSSDATKRAEIEKKIFQNQIDDELKSLSDFKKTEEQLLSDSYSKKVRDVMLRRDLTEEQKRHAITTLQAQHLHELDLIQSAKDARIAAANEANLSTAEAARKRYTQELKQLDQLIDREEALAQERAINREYISLGVKPDEEYLGGFATSSSQIQLGQEDQLNNAYVKQFEEMQLRYAQQRELAIQQNKELTQIEADYLAEKARLNSEYDSKIQVARQADHEAQLSMYGSMLSQASSVWGDMTQIVRDSAGEQSGAYKAMFLAQQMFAIGSAMISTHLAATQAMAAPDMALFGQKIAAPAAITALGYANVGMIAAQTIAGFKNGGLITGPGTGTSDSIPIMASNEEFMMRHAAVKSIGVDNLNYMNKYGKLPEQTNRVGNNIASAMNGSAVNVQVEPKIIVNVPEGFTAQQSQSSDGTITLDVVDRMTAQNLSNPNSETNKAYRRTYSSTPRR